MYWQVRVDYWVFRLECPSSGLSHLEMINTVIISSMLSENYFREKYTTNISHFFFVILIVYFSITETSIALFRMLVVAVFGSTTKVIIEDSLTFHACFKYRIIIADVRRHASWQYDANNTQAQGQIAQE